MFRVTSRFRDGSLQREGRCRQPCRWGLRSVLLARFGEYAVLGRRVLV